MKLLFLLLHHFSLQRQGINLIYLFLGLSLPFSSMAQENLVPNPCFSKLNSCVSSDNPIINCKHWFVKFPGWNSNMSGSGKSYGYNKKCNIEEDYYHNYDTIPQCGSGNVSIVTISTFCFYDSTYYQGDCISVLFNFLKANLKKKFRYYARFHVINISGFGVSKLGMKFFQGADTADLYRRTPSELINGKPQIYTQQLIPANKKALYREEYQKIDGTFVATEHYNSIGIGLFFPPSEVDTIKVPEFNDLQNTACIYSIDDVGVYEVPRITSFRDTSICRGDSVQITLKGGKPYYLSKKSSKNDTFSTDSTLWVQPNETTTYYINSYIRDSVKVRVYDPPSVNLGKDRGVCPKDTLILNARNKGAHYRWNTGDTKPELAIHNGGKYWVKAQVGSCKDRDTVTIHEKPAPPPLNVSGEKAFCPRDQEKTALSVNEQFQKILWEPLQKYGETLTIQDTGNLKIIATGHNGCTRTKEVEIASNCTTRFYVPNAFSPNNDGHNDRFCPKGGPVKDYQIKIYSRFGEKVFESSSMNDCWKGRYNGKMADEGVYLYLIEYTAIIKNNIPVKKIKKGTITLLK